MENGSFISLALVSFPTWGAAGVKIDASGEDADARWNIT